MCLDNACLNNPCLNGATCQAISNAFICLCPQYYSGSICQTSIVLNFEKCEIYI